MDFFRGRYSWRKLTALLSQLPSASKYKESLSQDPDVLAYLETVDLGKVGGGRVPQSEWNMQTELLAATVDAVHSLIALTQAVNSEKGKYRPPKPVPRPRSAVDVARAARRQKEYDELVALVTAAQQHSTEPEGETL